MSLKNFSIKITSDKAKDDKHRTRAIVCGDGTELTLSDRPMLFRYVGTIQEEVHRFAISYHHKVRNRNAIHSILDNIKGVGPARRNALLHHFGTVERIRQASLEELLDVPGMTRQTAENIQEYFG